MNEDPEARAVLEHLCTWAKETNTRVLQLAGIVLVEAVALLVVVLDVFVWRPLP